MMGLRIFRSTRIILLIAFSIFLSFAWLNTAFSQGEDVEWSDPVNLSGAGSTTTPIMVMDSNERFHVIWIDQLASERTEKWQYTTGGGHEWAEPITVDFPFGDFQPKLFADSAGFVHALWIGESGELLTSRASAEFMGAGANWTEPFQLAESAGVFDLALDSSGIMHLVYIRDLNSAELPAGVYYRKSSDNGSFWTPGVPLYVSSYLRSATAKNSSIDIVTTDVNGIPAINVVFDNQPLHLIVLIKSADGGETWGEPANLDAPNEKVIPSTPFSPTIGSNGEEVLVLWGTELQSAFDCTLVYQASADGGKSWEVRHSLLTEFVGCPSENQLFTLDNGQMILMSRIDKAVYLMAWDGSNWSDPQAQPELYSFMNPDTFTSVIFGCRQAVQTKDDVLFVVGCDTVGGGDIWLRSRPFGDSADWFPPPTSWSKPVETGTGVVDPETLSIQVDLQNNLHAIWSQENKESTPPNRKEVYYMEFVDQGWSTPVSVLKSPEGNAIQPTSVIDQNNRIHVVWIAEKSEELYYSWVEVSKAGNPFEWAKPQLISISQANVSSPSLLTDGTGKLFLVYAVPVNEDRGIYLVESGDGGKTWSTPQLLFNAGEAGWTMVDKPLLDITGDVMSLMFTRNIIGEGNPSAGLYYSRSSDIGKTWSALEQIDELPVLWSALKRTDSDTVHRMWQVAESDVSSEWHEFSPDNGVTWSKTTNFSRFGEIPLAISVSTDIAGRLHLFEVVQDIDARLILKHWIWDNEVWKPEQDSELNNDEVKQGPSGLASVITSDGSLTVLASGIISSDTPDIERMFSTGRLIDLPLSVSPPITETQVITSIPDVTPTVETVAVITQPVSTQSPGTPAPTQSSSGGTAQRMSVLIIGAAIALIVIAAIAGVIIYFVRQPGKDMDS